MAMSRTAMVHGRSVDIIKVGHMWTEVEFSHRHGDHHRESVHNRHITPQPCGICKGTGKILWVKTCGACEGKGHSPNKNPDVERLVKTAEVAFQAGVAAGTARRAKQRDVIDAAEIDRIFGEPENFELCRDCCVVGCDGTCDK